MLGDPARWESQGAPPSPSPESGGSGDPPAPTEGPLDSAFEMLEPKKPRMKEGLERCLYCLWLEGSLGGGRGPARRMGVWGGGLGPAGSLSAATSHCLSLAFNGLPSSCGVTWLVTPPSPDTGGFSALLETRRQGAVPPA